MDLPEDVVFQILLWLPVMTLLRFKSVCKSWRSLIESPAFINQHLDNNVKYNGNGKGKVISIDCYGKWEDGLPNTYRLFYGDKFDKSRDLSFDRPWYEPKNLFLMDCCNGIICLHNVATGELALWNPATRQLRPLPESPIPRRVDLSMCRLINQTFVAFGFDVKTNDYKVVRIIVFDQRQVGCKPYGQVEVYSLSTDSWEIIHTNLLLPLDIIMQKPRAARNGMCFWFGYSGEIPLLLSFNLSNNVIGTVPVPESCDYTQCIDFMDDKLALIYVIHQYHPSPYAVYEYNNRRFEIWVLQDNVSGSWIKLHTFGPFDNFCPMRFSMNGQCLLVAGYKVFLYDILTQEMIIVHDFLPDDFSFSVVEHDFISYNESLVQIQRADPSQDPERVSTET